MAKKNKVNKDAYIDTKKEGKKGTVSFPDTEITEAKIIAHLRKKGGDDLVKKYKLDKARKRSAAAKKRATERISIYAVEEYWCAKCERIHKKYRKSDGKKIKIYYDHKEHARKLDKAELWKEQFRKNWQRAAKASKKSGQAVGTPKREKKRSRYK